MQARQELLDQYDPDELIELKGELKSRLEEYRDEHRVESLEELRDRVEDTDDLRQTASDWEIVRYRLSLVRDVIDNYEIYDHSGGD